MTNTKIQTSVIETMVSEYGSHGFLAYVIVTQSYFKETLFDCSKKKGINTFLPIIIRGVKLKTTYT